MQTTTNLIFLKLVWMNNMKYLLVKLLLDWSHRKTITTHENVTLKFIVMVHTGFNAKMDWPNLGFYLYDRTPWIWPVKMWCVQMDLNNNSHNIHNPFLTLQVGTGGTKSAQKLRRLLTVCLAKVRNLRVGHFQGFSLKSTDSQLQPSHAL